METVQETLNQVPMLKPLGSEGCAALAGFMETSTFEAGQQVYSEGDPVSALFIVQSGVINLMATLEGKGTRRFLTLREGAAFGMLSLSSDAGTTGSAVATEDATILILSHEQIDAFGKAHPGIAPALWQCILTGLGSQMKILVDDYRRIAAWARDVTAAGSLNLFGLAAEGHELELELLSGVKLKGSLLKVDTLEAATLITFRTSEGAIHVVPYHAVAQLTLPDSPVSSDDIPAI